MSDFFTPLPLRAESEFFTTARRHPHTFFTCWYQFGDGHAQATVVVGKKVSAKAVDRHRLKRQSREILRSTPAPTGLKAVFVLKPAALNTTLTELKASMTEVVAHITHESTHPTHH